MLWWKIYDYLHHGLTYRYFKIKYGERITISKGTLWRSGLKITISENAKIRIGEKCFFNNYCSINSRNLIEIGNNSIFGEGVKIYDHNHKFNKANFHISDQGFTTAKIKIGNNCWVGSNVIILKGVTIGDNCVIGAGCIVNQDIPSNTIVTMNRNIEINKIRLR